MNPIITTALFSGIAGAVIASVISGLIQHKHFKGALAEKWACDLRNEIAEFMGLTESLRGYCFRQSEFYIQDRDQEIVDLTHRLVSKQQKIHMLLNDDDDQQKIFELVSELMDRAYKIKANSNEAKENCAGYSACETQLVKCARQLLLPHQPTKERIKISNQNV
ncbi:hypothetical protein [Tichowtungia aerotolerans]|uniref:Uncharacterized protein n=1 Tax=Tichowtungia aerotolerans TaxID=2697043 RepID=A0A6P1M6Q0_9BACT|nr:hypothetical protein [Tichowtungia aerotolerans]QHI69531.1 hypothetical protein GT409_08700 [Tichowtungia aerotolerans]